VRIDLVGFGWAAMNRPPREGMTPHEGDPFLHPAIGEPIPGEETLAGAAPPLPIGGHGLQQGFRSRLQVAVQQAFPLVTPDAHLQGAGMQVDPPGKLVLIRVEAHEGSSSVVRERCSQHQHTSAVC
jgi:hypothetical protein